MMYHSGFLKGVGLGLVVGAAATAAVVPMDRKRMMRSAPGRTLRALTQVLDNFL